MMKQHDSRVLKRIRYESSGGSMIFHSEFELEADKDEVIRTSYWHDFIFSPAEEEAGEERLAQLDRTGLVEGEACDIPVREHIPADPKLWQALAEEIEYLKEQLRPFEKKLFKPMPEVFVLDGGDYSRLYITWETDGEEQTVQYYPPSGNRWGTVLSVLHEMARPVGRDLHREGETQLTDFLLKAPGYSYQIKPISNDSGYYFFVHGDESDLNRLSAEQWHTVRDFLNGLDLSGFGKGRYEDKYYLQLHYSDGLSRYLKADKKTAERIRSFIRKSFLDH